MKIIYLIIYFLLGFLICGTLSSLLKNHYYIQCTLLVFLAHWIGWCSIWEIKLWNFKPKTPLQKSIKKYEKIVSILMLNIGKSYSFSEGDFSVDGKLLFKFGGSYCDLCKNYSCYRCPVYYKTNETMCCGTPYDKILEYRNNHPTGIITQKVIDLFIDELNFLRTLKEPNND